MKKVVAVILMVIVTIVTPVAHGSTATPCINQNGQPSKILIVILENHSFDQVTGQMPYLNNLASKCTLLTNMHAIAHPSLPNYLALTSGSTDGITNDGFYHVSADNIFHQLGSNWADYAQSMPKPCDTSNAFPYIVHHNPAPYYTDIAGTNCNAHNVSYSQFNPGSLPVYSIIVPDKCHDGHKLKSSENCGSGTELSRADNWLSTELPKIFSSSTYTSGNLLVVVTWDEGSKARNPATDPIYTVLAGATLPAGSKVTTSLSHYSLLRYAEGLANVSCLQNACKANNLVLP